MASKTKITPNNIQGWLAALGYIFPATEGELLRFERLYADMHIPEEELIDPEVVLGRKSRKQTGAVKKMGDQANFPLRMAARNGNPDLPQHILDRIKKNQQKPPTDGSGSQDKVD